MPSALDKAKRIYREEGPRGLTKAMRRKISDAVRGEARLQLLPGQGEAWTEYMSWLSFANAGMLTQGNVDCFDYAIRNLPGAAPLVEIGSFCGLSANVIAYLKQKHGVKNPLFTCDRWQFEGAETGGALGDSRVVTHADYAAYVKETFRRNAEMFSRHDLPFTIEAFSDEFFAAWAAKETRVDVFGRNVQLGGPIGFCYIDGNHSYDFAKRDFENCDRWLERGGFILFDDSAIGTRWDVCKVAEEVAALGRYEVVARNPNWFFRKLS